MSGSMPKFPKRPNAISMGPGWGGDKKGPGNGRPGVHVDHKTRRSGPVTAELEAKRESREARAEMVIETWYEMATSDDVNEFARLQAGEKFVTRVLGPVAQRTEISGPDRGPVEITDPRPPITQLIEEAARKVSQTEQ